MGRLVDLNDAKALIEDIYKRDKDTINMSYKKDNIINGLDELDTAYDVDAVVEQLEKKIQTHERCIEYEKKNGTITEEFQQRKAVEVLKDAINIVKAGLKPCYISKEQVKELWDKKPICIEFADGSDALAQENGYTLEQCLAMSDVRFFLDVLEKNKQK